MITPGNSAPVAPQSTPLGEGAGVMRDDPAILGGQALRIYEQYPRISDSHYRREALGRFRVHLDEIANDPSGSDPAQYSSPEDQALYAKIKEMAFSNVVRGEAKPWPRATPITHEETTLHWLRFGKKDPVVRDAHGKPVVGYRVGYLNVSQFETPVLFCSDGKLRMLIKYANSRHRPGSHDKRTFSGYCRLPDPELLYPVRDLGSRFAVSYRHGQSNTLTTEVKRDSGGAIDITKTD